MVLINPASEADEESMRDRMESRRAREKAEKKAKKESGKKRGGEAADFKVPGGIQSNAAACSSSSNQFTCSRQLQSVWYPPCPSLASLGRWRLGILFGK